MLVLIPFVAVPAALLLLVGREVFRLARTLEQVAAFIKETGV